MIWSTLKIGNFSWFCFKQGGKNLWCIFHLIWETRNNQQLSRKKNLTNTKIYLGKKRSFQISKPNARQVWEYIAKKRGREKSRATAAINSAWATSLPVWVFEHYTGPVMSPSSKSLFTRGCQVWSPKRLSMQQALQGCPSEILFSKQCKLLYTSLYL